MKVMGAVTKTLLHGTDFVRWADETASKLRARRLREVDLNLVAEEIEGLAARDRRAIASQLRRLIMHVLKLKYQPERSGRSWLGSIVNARVRIDDMLEESQSLRGYLEARLPRIYGEAVKIAQAETGIAFVAPSECPWALDQLLRDEPAELARRG